MDIRVRAAIRTAIMVVSIAIVIGLIYAFAILGMLPGVIILCTIGLVFIMYDTNRNQIEIEDKFREISKKYQK